MVECIEKPKERYYSRVNQRALGLDPTTRDAPSHLASLIMGMMVRR